MVILSDDDELVRPKWISSMRWGLSARLAPDAYQFTGPPSDKDNGSDHYVNLVTRMVGSEIIAHQPVMRTCLFMRFFRFDMCIISGRVVLGTVCMPQCSVSSAMARLLQYFIFSGESCVTSEPVTVAIACLDTQIASLNLGYNESVGMPRMCFSLECQRHVLT